MNTKITVSGNIVGELSEKIPSNIIALNELIKNAYDAGAKEVSISLDTKRNMLIIADDGEGMNEKDIDTLFHISNSDKIYGETSKYNRLIQGSKGLGFLSVFKFGSKVNWRTYKGTGLAFSVDFYDLIKSEDISEYFINIQADEDITKGTQIVIQLDEYNSKSMMEYFTVEKNYKKILNSFDDKGFKINLQINNAVYSSTDFKRIKENWPEKQMYYVTYNSVEQVINYYYNDRNIIKKDFKFNDSRYKLDIELIILQLPPYGKAKIDTLFLNDKNDLTPLVYVNDNLFNNYDLFDPNLMKNIKTGSTLNQMIGYIRIVSKDKLMGFNSDRSQFLQNELSDSIKKFLRELNKTIQETGSLYKKYLVDFNFLTEEILPCECAQMDVEDLRQYIKSDFSFKMEVEIIKHKNNVVYNLFGRQVSINIANSNSKTEKQDPEKESANKRDEKNQVENGSKNSFNKGKNNLKPAVIQLKYKEKDIMIPSSQINMVEMVDFITDSQGNNINAGNVIIKVDGSLFETTILPSFNEEKSVRIEYIYEDLWTGKVVEELKLNFCRSYSKIYTKLGRKDFITLPSSEGYTITYNSCVGRLINQINSLEVEEYQEVIACSLRAIIDISLDVIQKSIKYEKFFDGVGSGFESRVLKIITHVRTSKLFKGAISKSASIDFHSLDNMLEQESFKRAISTAHLATHKSTSYVSGESLEHLASKIGIFVVVINEMINNVDIS